MGSKREKIAAEHGPTKTAKKDIMLKPAQESVVKRKVAELMAETEALRQRTQRLKMENQRLRAELSKLPQLTAHLDELEERVLIEIGQHRRIAARQIARRLKLRPAQVDQLLENLELEGYVRPSLSVAGTFYSLRSSGRDYLLRRKLPLRDDLAPIKRP